MMEWAECRTIKTKHPVISLLFNPLQGMFHVEHEKPAESAFPESLLSLHRCL